MCLSSMMYSRSTHKPLVFFTEEVHVSDSQSMVWAALGNITSNALTYLHKSLTLCLSRFPCEILIKHNLIKYNPTLGYSIMIVLPWW